MTTPDSNQATSQTQNQPVPDQGTPAAAVVSTPAVAAAPGPAAAAPVKVELAAAVPAVAASEPKPGEAPVVDPAKPAVAETPPVAAPVIPETYALPEIKDSTGKAIALNPEMLPVMAPAFKAAGLTQDAVNGLVKTFVDYQSQMVPKMLARDLEVTMKDPDLGGMNWGKTQGVVNEALTAFTTPEFRSKLERWGIANDLEFVRVFAAIGKAMRGDSPERGQPSSVNELSQADRIYGRVNKA